MGIPRPGGRGGVISDFFFKFSTQETHKWTASSEKRCWSAHNSIRNDDVKFSTYGEGTSSNPLGIPLGLNIDKLISLQVRVEISKTSPGFCHDVCCFKWLGLSFISNDYYIHTSNPAASSRLWSSYTRRTLERNRISTRRAKKRSIFPCNILRRTQRQFGKPQPFQKTSSYLRFVRHIVLFPVSSANRKWNISSRDNSCRLVRYSKKCRFEWWGRYTGRYI